MRKDDSLFKDILLKHELSTKDQQYFSKNPYYRATDGTLTSDFESLKNLWSSRILGEDFEIIEQKDHLLYFQMQIDKDEVLYGKLVFEDNLIKYLYETVMKRTQKRYLCTISYDGTRFEGYQKQIGKRTVQGSLEDALSNVFKEDVQIYASGRTDKGVHAYHQTLHFDAATKIPLKRIKMVIRQYIPEDIVIKEIKEISPIFHARYDVVSKTYMYHIDYGEYDVTKRNYRWYVGKFDIAKFKQALQQVVGQHDFASFTKTTEKTTTRTISEVAYEEHSQELKVWITGTGFLRYMVRNLVMAAYLIATDKLEVSMEELLKRKDNTILRHIASPSGLYLYDVTYE